MKSIRYISYGIMTALALTMSTGCLEEAFPENGSFTEGQLKESDKATLVRACAGYFQSNGGEAWDIGYVGFQMFWDAMTEDFPTNNESWDYFRYFNNQISIGYGGVSHGFWLRNYYMAARANSVLNACDKDPEGSDATYMGTGYVFRILSYMNLSRMFEYKHTGVARLDQQADETGIWGLTVPIILETTTEAESRAIPRAPFYEMYRFINSDLLNAEKYLANCHTAENKGLPCLGTAYGLAARFWLEVGTRFIIYPADLAMQVEMESDAELGGKFPALGIRSAADCFRKAADYARKAINEGFTPLTKAQWYDTATGFNTPNDAWLWAIIVSPNDDPNALSTWKSIAAYKANEARFGMCEPNDFKVYRLLDVRLYDKIDRNDWRRDTWIDPVFAAMDNDSEAKQEMWRERYASRTTWPYEEFCKYTARAGFKFRPGSGNGTDYKVGNMVSVPLMRIEEMYLIEAEALCYCEGAGAGKAALESFMNSYRMEEGSTFHSQASMLEDVVDDIITQKRLELWGEGEIYFDYKRREMQVVRGYPGTNHPVIYRYNSYPGYVAPWMNFYIYDRVRALNPTVILNPDPNRAIPTLWVEE